MVSLSPREMAAASTVAEHQASLVQDRGDADEIEAFFAGWRFGNQRDHGVEPTLGDYDDWRRGQLAEILPVLRVRCDRPGAHPEHSQETVIDGQRVEVVCNGETREEDIRW